LGAIIFLPERAILAPATLLYSDFGCCISFKVAGGRQGNPTAVAGEHRTGVHWLQSILIGPAPGCREPQQTVAAAIWRLRKYSESAAKFLPAVEMPIRPVDLTPTLDLCGRRSLIEPRSFLAVPSKEVCNMS